MRHIKRNNKIAVKREVFSNYYDFEYYYDNYQSLYYEFDDDYYTWTTNDLHYSHLCVDKKSSVYVYTKGKIKFGFSEVTSFIKGIDMMSFYNKEMLREIKINSLLGLPNLLNYKKTFKDIKITNLK
jgi:hypothetical protein